MLFEFCMNSHHCAIKIAKILCTKFLLDFKLNCHFKRTCRTLYTDVRTDRQPVWLTDNWLVIVFQDTFVADQLKRMPLNTLTMSLRGLMIFARITNKTGIAEYTGRIVGFAWVIMVTLYLVYLSFVVITKGRWTIFN